jgi:hypothetical protein
MGDLRWSIRRAAGALVISPCEIGGLFVEIERTKEV